MVPRVRTVASVRPGPDSDSQRTRILTRAFELLSAHGGAGMSMRQLATACGLNVATLYHYFPSKSALLSAVIGERDYPALMRDYLVPVDHRLAPRRRLERLLLHVWAETLAEEPVWRLLIGESLRGEHAAVDAIGQLGTELERAVDRWLGQAFPPPELATDHRSVTSVVTTQLLGLFLEHLVVPGGRDPGRSRARIRAAAAIVFPD